MQPHAAWMDTEIGHVLWWIARDHERTLTDRELIDRVEARGFVHNRQEARNIVRMARSNEAATGRARQASLGQSLRSACDYKCPDDTPIGLRLRFNLVDADGNVLESRSIVVRARASENLGDVLARATALVNQTYRRGNRYYGTKYTIQNPLDTGNIDQVLLNYNQAEWV